MKHNPYNFRIGDIVIIDKDFSNSGRVTIKDFSGESKIYAQVFDQDEDPNANKTWWTMTTRLSPILHQKEQTTLYTLNKA